MSLIDELEAFGLMRADTILHRQLAVDEGCGSSSLLGLTKDAIVGFGDSDGQVWTCWPPWEHAMRSAQFYLRPRYFVLF